MDPVRRKRKTAGKTDMSNESLVLALDGSMAWCEFLRLLHNRDEKSFHAALALNKRLSVGGWDLIEDKPTSQALCDWAEIPKCGWSNEQVRQKLTEELWTILDRHGAHNRINLLTAMRSDSEPRFSLPLHVSCGYGALTATTILVQCPETDVNLRNVPKHETALMHCLHYWKKSLPCFQAIVKFRLLDVDVDATNYDGKTLQDLLNGLPKNDSLALQFQVTWKTCLKWLEDVYWPGVFQQSIAHLLSDLAVIVTDFLVPRAFQ